MQYVDSQSHKLINGTPQLDLKVDWDLRECLRALPTKKDIRLLITAVEVSCKQVVEGLREDIAALGHRVEKVETGQDNIRQVVANTQAMTTYYERVLNTLMDQMDDHENRECLQNIRIKGLPTTIQPSELPLTVIGLFCLILGALAPKKIETDRVHRVLSFTFQNADKTRDVICKMHRYRKPL